MVRNSMIYGGFDLSFIDIDIQPIESDAGHLIQKFPKIGSHHRDTKIDFRPGGNGFNLCRTLANLGREVTYVGPSSELFDNIVASKKIPLNILPIKNAEVSLTAILNMKDGEIQFNSVNGYLSYEHVNEELLKNYASSPLKSISNVSLNPTSIEWISSLLISLIDIDSALEMTKTSSLLEILQSSDEIYYDGVLFIDPSDISHFSRLDEFIEILTCLKKFKGEKYFSVNEFELNAIQNSMNKSPKEIAYFLDLPIIFHTADEVTYYGKDTLKIPTKKISSVKTFVGAGDCFNGGFLHSIFDSQSVEDSLSFAIETASHLIETGKYPN